MKYGRLTLLKKTNKKTHDNRYLYIFECDCGNIIERSKHGLTNGRTQSCGCLRKEIAAKAVLKVQRLAANAASISNKKHGMKGTRFYRIWGCMKNRCNDSNNTHYGKRGIKVCDKWKHFKNFRADMFETYTDHVSKYGEANTSIDRIDSNGDYELSNCRWATKSEQTINSSSMTRPRNEAGQFMSNL